MMRVLYCFADWNDCDYPKYTACDRWNGATWVRSAHGDSVLMSGKKYDGTSSYYSGGFHCDPGPFGEIIFYDADDFLTRISGELEPWEVVPYRTWRPSELWGAGRELGGIAYDPSQGRLYVIEKFAGPGGRAIVHVYRTGEGGSHEVRGGSTSS